MSSLFLGWVLNTKFLALMLDSVPPVGHRTCASLIPESAIISSESATIAPDSK